MASVSHYHLAVLCDSTHSVLIFLQYKPHRYNKSYMPKGFSTIADKWIGLCSYCNKASHERALCSECAPLSDIRSRRRQHAILHSAKLLQTSQQTPMPGRPLNKSILGLYAHEPLPTLSKLHWERSGAYGPGAMSSRLPS